MEKTVQLCGIEHIVLIKEIICLMELEQQLLVVTDIFMVRVLWEVMNQTQFLWCMEEVQW